MSSVVHAGPVLLGLCGFLLALLCTSRYGVGTFTDAEHHLHAARSLLAGEGYHYLTGDVYAQWPPLFPTLLGAIGLAGVDPQVSARWVNSAAYGLILLLSGLLLLRCTPSRVLALTGLLALLVSRSLLDWCLVAATEPLFIVFTIGFALCLPRFLHRRDWSSLLLVSAVTMLACLQRYAGISLVAAGALLTLVALSGTRLRQRLVYLAVFGAISVTPTSLWCVHNRIRTGRPLGYHQFHLGSAAEFTQSFQAVAGGVSTWLFPWARGESPYGIILGVVFVLVAALIAWPWQRRSALQPGVPSGREDTCRLYAASVLVITLVYFGFIALSGAILGWTPVQRHLVPIHALVMVAAFCGVEGIRRRLPAGARPRMAATSAGLILFALWFQYALRMQGRSVADHVKNGAGGYATSAWQNSPLVQRLRRDPLPGLVYTNSPDGIYLMMKVVTRSMPSVYHKGSLGVFAQECAATTPYLVWFNTVRHNSMNDLREILSSCRMEKVEEFPDGAIYRCWGPRQSQLSAVFRFWSRRTGKHLYTIDKQEREDLCTKGARAWAYEEACFYAFAEQTPGTCPIYRLWSQRLNTHFYTADEAEKDKVLREQADTWTYQDIAFYAYREKSAEDLAPVYRLSSANHDRYLYTISAREKNKVLDGRGGWDDEGVAWYAYAP